MRRSKKVLFSVSALALSAVVLTATALAGVQKVSGYEKLKEAGINMMLKDNYTMNGKMKFSLDGEAPVEITTSARSQDSSNSTTVTTVGEDGQQVKLHTEMIDGEMRCVYELPDGSFLTQKIGNLGDMHGNMIDLNNTSEKELRLMELVMDLFSGDVKNYFDTEGNRVSFTLQQHQVPELVQLLMSIATEPGNTDFDSDEELSITITDKSGRQIHSFDYSATEDQLPAIAKQKLEIFEGSMELLHSGPQAQFDKLFANLKDGLVVKNVHFEGNLSDDKLIKDIKVGIELSGLDKQGIEHVISLYMEMDITDYGATQVEKLDLTGAEVYELPAVGNRMFHIEMDELK